MNKKTWSIHFDDERDFLHFASMLDGQTWTHSPDALKQLSQPARRRPHGERTWGNVHATFKETDGNPPPFSSSMVIN